MIGFRALVLMLGQINNEYLLLGQWYVSFGDWFGKVGDSLSDEELHGFGLVPHRLISDGLG